MLRISDFSKLSHLTVKALRFYEKEALKYHRAAYLELHGDPDSDGGLSGSDYCRDRSD